MAAQAKPTYLPTYPPHLFPYAQMDWLFLSLPRPSTLSCLCYGCGDTLSLQRRTYLSRLDGTRQLSPGVVAVAGSGGG